MEFDKKQQKTQAKSILFTNNNLVYMQLGQIQKTVTDLVQQNKKQYQKIILKKPQFSHQLYKISQFQAISKAFTKQLLLRQMDRLLQQKNYLQKQLSLINFEDQQTMNQKQKMIIKQTNHFEMLKNIWKKNSNKKYDSALQHIEELNISVGYIKCNIQQLIKFQSNESKQFDDVYLKTFNKLFQKNKQCHKCIEYQAKIQFLKAKLQQTQQKLSKTSQQNIAYLQDITHKDQKLKKINKLLIKQQSQYKTKILFLEQDIAKKQNLIKDLQKQIKQYDSYKKFKNQQQNYQIYIKSQDFDLQKYSQNVKISLKDLTDLIFQKQTQVFMKKASIIKNNLYGPLQPTLSSSKSPSKYKQQISNLRNIQITNFQIQKDEQQFIKNNSTLSAKFQQIQANKRYVRSSKRLKGSTSSSKYDQNGGIITKSLFSK